MMRLREMNLENQKIKENNEPGTENNSNLSIKTRFFLPPHIEALMPGLVLTTAISALALHTGAKITYVTPLIASMGIGMLLRNAFIIPAAYNAGIFSQCVRY